MHADDTSDYPDKRQSQERVIPDHRPITRTRKTGIGITRESE